MADEAGFDAEAIQKYLKNLKGWLGSPATKDIIVNAFSSIAFKDVMDHFKKEMGSAGPWAAWSPQYARRMASAGRGDNKILQYNGKLRQNFSPADRRVTKDTINWFNNAKTSRGFPYAWGHDTGNVRGGKKRDFMWLSDQAASKMADIIWDLIQKGVDGEQG